MAAFSKFISLLAAGSRHFSFLYHDSQHSHSTKTMFLDVSFGSTHSLYQNLYYLWPNNKLPQRTLIYHSHCVSETWALLAVLSSLGFLTWLHWSHGSSERIFFPSHSCGCWQSFIPCGLLNKGLSASQEFGLFSPFPQSITQQLDLSAWASERARGNTSKRVNEFWQDER
jgi:hypothetical protein